MLPLLLGFAFTRGSALFFPILCFLFFDGIALDILVLLFQYMYTLDSPATANRMRPPQTRPDIRPMDDELPEALEGELV